MSRHVLDRFETFDFFSLWPIAALVDGHFPARKPHTPFPTGDQCVQDHIPSSYWAQTHVLDKFQPDLRESQFSQKFVRVSKVKVDMVRLFETLWLEGSGSYNLDLLSFYFSLTPTFHLAPSLERSKEVEFFSQKFVRVPKEKVDMETL